MTFELLPETAFVYILAFSRIGSAMMALPALGEMSISPRIRLVMALAVTAVLTPMVADTYPAMPLGWLGMVVDILSEILKGLFMGLVARIFISALQVTGTIVAQQTGLAFAMSVDPGQGVQSAIVGTFLAFTGVVMIFVTDMHHIMLVGIRDSYTLFPPTGNFPTADFVTIAVETLSQSFKLGVQMAAPFLVFSLIFYLGVGVLAKLIPQVQVFFVAMPANILLGFVLLFLLVSAMMLWFLENFETALMRFVL